MYEKSGDKNIFSAYFVIKKNSSIFATLFRKHNVLVSWCNGSTADFGSACRSSNLRETTPQIADNTTLSAIFVFINNTPYRAIAKKSFDGVALRKRCF